MESSEKELITGLLTGREDAFRKFYAAYAPRLSHFIKKKIDNEDDAEELLQDTLFAFLERVRDFNGESKLSTYLCAIARYKIIDFYRKRRLKQTVFSQLPEGFIELFSYIITPEKEFDQTFLREKIQGTLRKLPLDDRKLLLLKYHDGFSVTEIAQKMSCSFKSAESSLFRARKAFQIEFAR